MAVSLIRRLCALALVYKTAQRVPQQRGKIMRCIYEGLFVWHSSCCLKHWVTKEQGTEADDLTPPGTQE